MTETVFYRWMPIVNAWVKDINGHGMELRGEAIQTPPFGTGVMTFTPLTALASYRVQRPIGNSIEAAERLELNRSFARDLINAIYHDEDTPVRRRLLDSLR